MVLCSDHLRFTMPNLSAERAALWLPHLTSACEEFGIDSARRMAAFLAQIAHESAELSRTVENLNYSAVGLRSTWPSRFTATTALKYARKPEAIANKVYGGRLGNGPESSGDGWRYRGRGAIQTTGKANYEATGKALGLPLVEQPELLEKPEAAARSAAWYWYSHGLNELADLGTGEAFAIIIRRINGGLTGHAERTRYWSRARQAFGC